MHHSTPPHFRKTLLSLAACALLSPHTASALDLMQAPPGTVQPYVAPNVILSLDDSGSMDGKDMVLKDPSKPYNSWSNPYTKTRLQVLQDALKEVFNDKDLLPDNKIRMAWQSFGLHPAVSNTDGWKRSDCVAVSGLNLKSLNSEAASKNDISNSMRTLDSTHRENFIKYANALKACTNTPTHWLVKQADEYMRAPLHINGPWADKPTSKLSDAKNNNKPLGCRRNYHILLTDGDWNGYYRKEYPINTNPINFDNQDSEINTNGAAGTDNPIATSSPFFLPDGTAYKRSDPQTWVYRDIDFPTWSDYHPGYKSEYISSLADWSFKSWATNLQSPSSLHGEISPLPEYDKAPPEETFTNSISKKQATLKKYWNPRYNPSTWPHMVTFTIGFSTDSIPKNQYRPVGNNTESEKNIGRYWINEKIGNKWYEKKDGPLWQYDGPELANSNNAATNNGNNGKLITPSSTLPYGYDGSFADYAAGRAQWFSVKGGEAGQDMWHAAINGRGQFYAVEKAEELKEAFRQIVKTINANVEPDMTSTATSGSNASRNDVGKFTGSYEPKNGWKGFVSAETVKTDGTTEPAKSWGGKNTADKLDALTSVDSRVVLSWSDQWVSAAPKGGVPFRWATDQSKLSSAQKLWLQKRASGTDDGAAVGENRLNYIRGDQSKEGTGTVYRQRKSRQGDIVNSVVWYTGAPASSYALKGYSAFITANAQRTPMIYVGGNDGMLHGFSATDGSEKIAYVPQGVIPSLSKLTAPEYNQQHRYFVDGSPMTGDVDTGTGIQDPSDKDYNPAYVPDWRTLLVGTLGAGGKGYFVLDVTAPSTFAESQAASLVKFDRTRSTESGTAPDCAQSGLTTGQKAACSKAVTEDKDIGHITAQPVTDENNSMRAAQITRMNNNRWAVVLGNGYNSANQRPVLLIQYLGADPKGNAAGDKALLRIPTAGTVDVPPTPGTGLANENGLSAPRLVDLNGDGRVDIAYAGDNQGNLWKFDLLSTDDANWGVAFSGSPLFTAKGGTQGSPDSRTLAQPITIAPTVRANDRSQMVGSGTDAVLTRVGGMMVAFGTGRNVTKADENNRNMQTLYSVLDNTRYRLNSDKRLEIHPGTGTCTTPPQADCVPAPKALGSGAASAGLEQRTIEDAGKTGQGRIVAANDIDWTTQNGFYLDYPATGERQLKSINFYDSSNSLNVFSQVPAKGSDAQEDVESCESGSVDEERQYQTLVNIMDGKRPTVQIIDANGDGLYTSADSGISRTPVTKGPHTSVIIPPPPGGPSTITDIDVNNNKRALARMPEQSLRPSWRQLK